MFEAKTFYFTVLRIFFGLASVAVLVMANNLLGQSYDYFSIFIATMIFYSSFDLGISVATAFQYKNTGKINPLTFALLLILLLCIAMILDYDVAPELSVVLLVCLVDVWLNLIIFNTVSASGRLLSGELIRGVFELCRTFLLIYIFYENSNNMISSLIFFMLISYKVILILKYVDRMPLRLGILLNNISDFKSSVLVSIPIGLNAIIGTYVILLLKENLVVNDQNVYFFDLALKVLSFLLIFSTPIFFKYLNGDAHEKTQTELRLLMCLSIASFSLTALTSVVVINNYVITLAIFIICFSFSGWMEAYLNAQGKANIVLILSVVRVILLMSIPNDDFLIFCCVLTSCSITIIGIWELRSVKNLL